ncbi:Ku protein [Streptomyces xiangluensis]|uniref:Ku protein n=1 Tax=Streptomyces xiangluensis TaxID=2665720 RepID=A0ABV8YXY3_9ACTN
MQPAQPVAAKPYKLLVKALGRSAKVAIAKYAWSGRERLGLLRVKDPGVIVLHAMRWPDEIRDPAELVPPPVELTEDEIESALALVESMARDDLEGEDFRDTYSDALAEIIQAKREDKPLPKAPEPEAQGGKVFDLMAALNESVAKAKASRGEEPADVQELPKKETGAKKTTAKKQSAKNTGRTEDRCEEDVGATSAERLGRTCRGSGLRVDHQEAVLVVGAGAAAAAGQPLLVGVVGDGTLVGFHEEHTVVAR